MTMNLVLTSSPLLSCDDRSYSTSPMENVIPPAVRVVASLSAVLAAIEDYKRDVIATGKPAAVSAFKHHRCRGRKPAGFDAATARPILVNAEFIEVPAPRENALPPILNIDAAAIAAMPIGRGYDARVSPVFRVTKAEYSAIPTDYRGVRLSACGTFRFKIGLACFVPSAKDSGLSRHAYVALFVSDSKAHDMPESTAITAHAGVTA